MQEIWKLGWGEYWGDMEIYKIFLHPPSEPELSVTVH